MPTQVGTHDRLQRDGICCWLPVRSEEVFYCALPWIPAFAGMTLVERIVPFSLSPHAGRGSG
jgi:hypothetical protein